MNNESNRKMTEAISGLRTLQESYDSLSQEVVEAYNMVISLLVSDDVDIPNVIEAGGLLMFRTGRTRSFQNSAYSEWFVPMSDSTYCLKYGYPSAEPDYVISADGSGRVNVDDRQHICLALKSDIPTDYAKQGDNEEATNSKILEACTTKAVFVKNSESEDTYTIVVNSTKVVDQTIYL